MNDGVKQHIQESLAAGVRLDGRKLDEFRPINIETGMLATAEGSARVTCGDTEILAGVKMALGAPYPDRPDSGVLMVNAELRPMSNPQFELGPPSIEAIETSRVIDRGIRESKAIDDKKLCVEPGEKVWIVNVDVVPLNHDGNLIDVGGLASIAAVQDAKFPPLKDGQPDYKRQGKKALPLSQVPIPITVVKIGENLLVDPTQAEFDAADVRLTITTIGDDSVCSLQKNGEGSLSIEEVERMVDLSIQKGKELRDLLEKALKKAKK